MNKRHSESDLQRACYRLFCLCKPLEYGLLFMNHNNPRNAINGSLLKTMGLVAGVADMTYLHPDGVKFIEFKVDGGRQSEAQKNWQALVESKGYTYHIIRTTKEFCDLMNIQLSGV